MWYSRLSYRLLTQAGLKGGASSHIGVPSALGRYRGYHVYAIGTMDSKAEELAYLADKVQLLGSKVKVVDVSTKELAHASQADITSETILSQSDEPLPFADVADLPRGEAVAKMSTALTEFLQREHAAGRVAGVVGIGGSGGTSLISQAMRGLPVGVPKVLVSTVASGQVAPYVGTSDVTMMPSVVDVAGLNAVSRRVLSNAAAAISGMACQPPLQGEAGAARPTVGLTMFGVTTPCVDAVREALHQEGMDTLVFHATGTGGQAMEELVQSDMIQGVMDLTTTEVADHVVGGVMACSERRFEAAVRSGIPLVVSLGALDMVNFGAKETVPDHFQARNLFVHNPQVTLMRTNEEENRMAGRFIASKLNQATEAVTVLIPEGGVSLLDAPDMPFRDPVADDALFDTLEQSLEPAAGRKVVRVPHNINDPEFAQRAVREFLALMPAPQPAPPPPRGAAAAEVRGAAPEVAEVAPAGVGASREQIMARLRKLVAAGQPIIGAGAGTGISAKCEEAGGADLIVIYNSGRFRMAGRGSLAGCLPYADANAVVMDMAREVIPVVKHTPVLAGVCGTDPFRSMPHFLQEVKAAGFAGVQNFPTVGLMDGTFRQNLEETGMGFCLEVEMVRQAAALGLLTTPYAFEPEQAAAMAAAGADVVVAHVGLTTAGTIGAATALPLPQAARAVQAMAEAALAVNPDVLVLCHGGPIAGVEDATYILHNTGGNVHGFYGASSMERLPVETAIANCVREFKSIRLPH